jgi:hypothetical protein
VQTFTAYALRVAKAGKGSGKVMSSPAGISCGSTCSHAYPSGATVTLTATPAKGSTFKGWAGACKGTKPCRLGMKQARSVTATFSPKPVCIVPTLKGKSLATARHEIKRAHCRGGTITHRYSTVRTGHVISQKPHPKRRLRAGARVSLVVSKGRRP